jgi:hypothetical protein
LEPRVIGVAERGTVILTETISAPLGRSRRSGPEDTRPRSTTAFSWASGVAEARVVFFAISTS